MATLIQSKQIEGIVTASVIQGDFQVSGDISASIISASQIVGVKYSDVEGTPNFVGGSGITITQVGDTYTFTNTGGGGVDDGVSDAASILQINAYTASNDLVIQRFEETTSSLQTQITTLSSSLSNIEVGTTDFSELTGVPQGIISSSTQVFGGTDVVSGSVLRTLDGTNVLSGSKTDITHLNQFTSSYYIDSSSFDSRIDIAESFAGQVDQSNTSHNYLSSGSSYDFYLNTPVGLIYSNGDTINIQSVDREARGITATVNSYEDTLSGPKLNVTITKDIGGTGYVNNNYWTITKAVPGYINNVTYTTFSESIQSQVDELILSSSTFITSETDSQTLTIVGDQLTISDGNTITIPTGSSGGVSSWNELTDIPSGLVSGSYVESLPSGLVSSSEQVLGGSGILSGSHTDITSLNDYTSSTDSRLTSIESTTTSLQSQIDGIVHTQIPEGTISSSAQITALGFISESVSGTSDFNELTNIPSGLVSSSDQVLGGTDIVSGSVIRTLDGTGVLSGSKTDISSLNEFTSSYLTDSASFDTRISNIGDHVNIGNLNEFTQSAESRLSALESATGSYLTSETDNQTLTIVGDQLTISAGNTITIPTGSNVTLPSGLISSSDQILGGSGILSGSHTDITSLNQFTSSVQTEIDGLSSLTSSYLTELPTDLVSGSVLRTLDGTDVLSGSIIPGTGITIDSSSGDYVITAPGGDGDTSFNGNREVTNTLLGDLFTQSFNAGTSGSIQDFLDAVFFPDAAPTAEFTTLTSNLNTNLTADGTVIETISISDTVDDSPYVVTLTGEDAFRTVPTNAASSSWEIQSIANLSSGTFTYDINVTDKNGTTRTYSGRTIEILQANAGTLSTTGTFYIIESATTGPIYLGSNGRGGSQGGVSVSYSPNYGSQVATNFQSSNSLISINSSTGVLSVGDPISGSGNISGNTITSTISWEDQYGNTDSDTISVNVTQNNAPDIIFTNSSALNTNQAVNGGSTLTTITFSDVESDSINHDSFQFTDPSGQLTATKSGGSYLVTANSDLSGSTTYSITASIEDVHGFRSNTESSSFEIVQHSNGTLIGDTTMYIIESALTNDSFRDATGFGNGNIAQVSVNYTPSAGSQTPQSFNSTNPAILIDSSGNMTLGVNLSGSVTQSGDSIETLITFQDQYGNIGSGSVTANIFGNSAPSVSFVATTDYDTDGATSNSNAGVITISDTESNSPYNVTLSGTDGGKFNAFPQNVASSSWQVQPTGSLTADTYSIDISVVDTYGESASLTNREIVVDDANATNYGTIYVYTSTFGSDAGFEANYLGVMGGATVNSDVPPQVTSYTANTLSPFFTLKGGSIGDNSITLAASTAATLRATISGDTTLDSALQNNGSIFSSGTSQIILVYPSGSDMVVPTTIQETINGVSGGGVPYLNVDSAGWGIESAQLHSIILDTPHLGFSEWYVLGRQTRDGIGTSFDYRIIDADGGSAPS